MMLFCLENLICSHQVLKKKGIMAEELEKYKQILKREKGEFQKVMKLEVSTSLPPKLIRKINRTLAKHVLLPISH